MNAGAAKRIALVAATLAEARDVMVEGESGLLAISSPIDRPRYEKTNRRLIWPNGAIALLFSDDEPDMLRGAQNDTAWCDELAKWKHLEATFDNLQLGLRLGARPQQAITTTPRTKKGLKAIMARSDTVITRGSTHDNRDNLAPDFFKHVIRRYEGTRFGRQEINAELLDDVPGALWTRAMLDAALMPKDASRRRWRAWWWPSIRRVRGVRTMIAAPSALWRPAAASTGWVTSWAIGPVRCRRPAGAAAWPKPPCASTPTASSRKRISAAPWSSA